MPELYPLNGGPPVEPEDWDENGEDAAQKLFGPEGRDERPSTEVQKWADVAMWQAPKHDDPQHPKVTVSVCTPDPLGVMAMVNGQYTGKVYRFPHEVSDEERREAWEAATVSLLSKAPLEWVQMSISFENVSRAFTHQLVRTRMAGYAQESQRFAVKTDMGDAVKLPPSLARTEPAEIMDPAWWPTMAYPERRKEWDYLSDADKMRSIWDTLLSHTEEAYTKLVNMGMPAEDARGILPTNTLTRVHMHIDMGTLLKLAGSRLCTQAQFEWRAVFAALAQALRDYGTARGTERWQFELMASAFRPVCFAEGHCPMQAKSDRHCSIREQVETFASVGVPSSEWEKDETWQLGVKPIHPAQWLADPTAARVAPGGN